MAPNRKQITTLLSSPADLANLQRTIQPKFLPLTHPKEEHEYVQRQQEQTKAIEPVASYWDWPIEAPQVETEKDLFSVANLESNLIQASNSIPVESSTLAANDDYWADAEASSTEGPAACSQPQHLTASYWDWETTTASEVTIQKIVEEDKAHRIVTASLQVQPVVTISEPQRTTVQYSTKNSSDHQSYWSWDSPVTAAHVFDVNHPLANYWDESTDSDKTMIEQLKEYEHARQVLSVVHLMQVLIQHPPVSAMSTTVTNIGSQEYWSWSEPLGDAYWDATIMNAVAAPSVTCGCDGYWDM